MINLLPPAIKSEIIYAKHNTIAVRYLWLVITVVVVITISFIGAHMYLNQRLAQTDKVLKQKETQIQSYKQLESQAKALNSRVAAIKNIQDNQPKFSLLLSDLARIMPRNATLVNLNLTGDDKKPVRITAIADTYATAVALRDSLAESSRISAVDIENISASNGGFSVNLIVGFKPGQAK